MEKRIVSIILIIALMIQCVPINTMGYPVPELGAQDSVSKFKSNVPVSVAHRSAWRNGPENSLIAINACIEMGIDVAELDVKLTKDGVVVLSHDSTIDRCAMNTGNVSNYTWDELKTIAVKPGQGGSSAYSLTEEDVQLLNSLPNYSEHCGSAIVGGTMPHTRLDDAIDLIKQIGPDTMINLDHCFSESLFVSCYILFRENGMLNNVFFKNSVSADTMNTWYSAAADAWNDKYPEKKITADDVHDSILYVYIISSEDYSILQSHLDNGDNLVMTEICISNDEADAKIQAKLEPWCKENGIGMFVNTMWSGLCSTKEDTETTWAEMLDRGYVAIQTDRPSELAEYMSAYNSERSSTDILEAEHFHMFNYDDYGLYIAAESDYNLNKKVEGMESGDYLEYRNIVFDGTESVLNLNLKGLSSGILSVYLDDMSSENLVAQTALSKTSDYETLTATAESEITEGKHTVYLKVSGVQGKDLVSIDNFRFVSSSDLAKNAIVSKVDVVTQVGNVPVLPNNVEVTADGEKYVLEVRWEQIPEENYSVENQFEVLGYIPVMGCYTKASVTVQSKNVVTPEIATDNLALWLDASEGVVAESNAVSEWKSKAGDITATLKNGSPTLVSNAAGGKKGVYFDGDDAMNVILPDDFWNEKSEFTVVMYVSSENLTSSSSNATNSQYNSVMYFGETDSWGSAYFNASQNEVMWRFGSGSSGDYGTSYARELSVGNMYTGTIIRKDGAQNTLFVDGEKIYTDTAVSDSTKNIKSDGWIGVGKNNNYFKGTICEILIYDTALSDEQIASIQQVLTEKYNDEVTSIENVAVDCEKGKSPELPKMVEVTYESGNVIEMGVSWESINPNYYIGEGKFTVNGILANGDSVIATVTVKAVDIEEKVTTTGMLFWMNSSDGITTDSDGKIIEWKSKVGDYYATNKKGDTSLKENAVNGKSAVEFDGDEDVLQMTLEDGRLNDLNGVTVVVYAASETEWNKYQDQSFDWNVQRRTLFYVDESGDWGSFYTGIYSDAISARFGTGTSQDYGFRAERADKNTGYTTTVIRWDGSNMAYDVDVDGTDFGTESSKAATTKNNKNIVYFGTGKENTYWDGTVCDIMLYDRVLTDTELQNIYDYLDEKYGTSNEIDVTGIYLKEAGQQLKMYRGDTTEITASVVPANAGNTKLNYSSSNNKVATVDENGKITATGFGYAAIIVTTEDGGFQSYCSVSVAQTDEQKIWQNIQDIVDWADAQEVDDYSNWDDMQDALDNADTVSESSSKEELTAVYNALREAMTALKDREIVVSDDVKVEGYQISTSLGGSRVVGSVESTINGKKVSKWGLVYAIVQNGSTIYDVSEKNMFVGTNNNHVASFESTSLGTVDEVMGDSTTATYFIRTTLFGVSTLEEFSAKYKVRAYALLEDNTYVYSDIHSYSVCDICHNLYQDNKMNSFSGHEYIYNNILKVVNPEYEEVEYDWSNVVIKPE